MNRLRMTSSFVTRFSLVCVVAIGVTFNIGAGGGAGGGADGRGSNGGGTRHVGGGAARAEEPTNNTRVDGNRLNYLDAPLDPYYPHRTFPKLTTPQWVGQPGVECVVTLGIDDMRDPVKYETFFRPILERLKKIDGRAPVSVMTCNVKPDDPLVAKWLSEGLSIECHTVDHPCPCLQGGDFAKAASTYHRCVDLMHEIPGNRPVAFRMPCCDSLNTPSPRFWAEIFNKRTEKGRFLQIDTSVFNIITTADETLPRELRYNDEGQSRFKRYIPFPSFVNTIEDYPYPYIIGGACWEFPCVVPSDWSAQHVQKPNNPDTVRDLKLALDATVLKQGTFNLVFHPHGWIRAEQIIELIDHAQAKHGNKVLFLTFADCLERLNKNLLGGRPLRNADGSSSGAMLADLNDDGYLDVIQLGPATTASGGSAAAVVTPADKSNTGETSTATKTQARSSGPSPAATKPLGRLARIWSPTEKNWSSLSSTVISPHGPPQSLRQRQLLALAAELANASKGGDATKAPASSLPSVSALTQLITSVSARTNDAAVADGLRLIDLDRDGECEAVIGTPKTSEVHRWNGKKEQWERLPFGLPSGVAFIDEKGRDAGLRIVDVDSDQLPDAIFSNGERYSLHRFDNLERGWSKQVISGRRGEVGAPEPVIPPIVRGDGTNNGAWIHSGHLWVQNEDTHRSPNLVDRVALADLLALEKQRDVKAKLPTVPVGAAKLDVTPKYAVRLSGYGNRKVESEGVAQPLWVKALAIGGDDGDGPALLLTLENCGLTPAMRTAVVTALAEKAKVRNERIVIAASHSHTAPALRGWAPFLFGEDIPAEHQKHIDQYTDEVVQRLVQVSLDALAARRPGRLAWGQGRVGFAANRRVLKDGQWVRFGVQADGPVDHSLPVLAARDEEGKLIAVVANYACHCTTLGGDFNKIAGDWAGYAQEMIEADHPGSVALITIGCGADANPEPRRSDLDLCKQHGRALADEVKRLLAGQLEPLDPHLTCRLRHVDLPFDTLPTREQWQERTKQSGAPGYHAKQFLAKLDRGEEIPTKLSYPIAVWTFGEPRGAGPNVGGAAQANGAGQASGTGQANGTAQSTGAAQSTGKRGDLAMVFLGGEVVVDYAIRLKSELDASRLWVTAYANDVCCYIASKRILREGGYEADFSMYFYARPTRWAGEVEDLISDTIQKLVPRWFYPAVKQADLPPPKSPDEALASIKVKPGFKVELVAAEPLVEDPVAFDWGPDGRLWVVEMRDYPNGLTWNGPGDPKNVPGGRVKVLRDTDGDGRYDKATVFLDDIPFPNGVKAWRGGVLVTAAPQVFYAEDHDGDDKADKRVTLFEGFVEGNQQHRTNGLRWGPDNWLYMANGDSGGTVKSFATGKSVSISGRDLRLRPDTGELDTQAGQTQFGRNRTDWGDWFGGNNANPMWHYVLEDHYLRRNPHVAPPENRKHVSVQPGASPVFPTSKTLARFNDFNMSNRFTSACSPEVYRDDWKWGGPPGATHVFICEPVHNLVHHEVMTADGATFTSRRADDEQQSEFFTSSDNWCRPVMVRTGPDGALWIADMYRAVIEHPEWIPLASQRKLDLRAGSNMGRIYRVVPDATAVANGASKSGGGSESGGGGAARAAVLAPPARAVPKLDSADVAGLVAALDSPNGWQRDTAQQLLVERFGPAPAELIASAFKSGAKQEDAARRQAIELLTRLARDSRRPVARLHALCTLDGINGLSTELVVAALADAHPGVRRHAARLAEPLLAKALLGNPTSSNDAAASAALGEALTRLIDDSDATVRIQTAYSLGAWDVRGGPVLARLAIKHQTDPYLVAAVLSSVNAANLRSVLTTVFAEAPGNPPARLVDPLLATATGLNDVKILDETLAAIAKPAPGADAASPYADWQLAAFGGLLDVLERRKMSLATLVSPATSKQLDALLDQARATAANTEATEARRIAAVRLVGRSTSKASDEPKANASTTASESATRDVETLVALLSPRNSTELQTAAVQSLARFRSPAVANRLLEGWKSHSPNLRAQILDALLSRDEGAQTLMTALKDGRVPPAQIDARRRQQLLAHRLTDVRQAAEKAFATASEPSRQKVLETFAGALTLPGDVGRGKATFTKKCAVCHRLEGQGHLVGPDIASIGNKSPEALLVAMLDPNRAIEDRYLDYSLLTIDGRTVTGILAGETGTSVTLLAQEGKSTTVLRNQIDELRSTGKSLMPEGLEKDLSAQDFADVIAYVRGTSPPPKSFPGNKPETVRGDDGGALRLLATTARIYGPKIVFEDQYRNLGYWSSVEDRAEWSVEVPKAGKYQVTLDYACQTDAAGDRFVIQIAGQSLGGQVEGTGTWDNYRSKSLGTIDLPAGPAELVMRSDGPIKSAMIDLRGIRITPAK